MTDRWCPAVRDLAKFSGTAEVPSQDSCSSKPRCLLELSRCYLRSAQNVQVFLEPSRPHSKGSNDNWPHGSLSSLKGALTLFLELTQEEGERQLSYKTHFNLKKDGPATSKICLTGLSYFGQADSGFPFLAPYPSADSTLKIRGCWC